MLGSVGLLVFRSKSIPQCWLSESRSWFGTVRLWNIICPAGWGWAGASRHAGLALPWQDCVLLWGAHMQSGSDCARLLHGCCLSTLHFHFLSGDPAELACFYLGIAVTVWKDDLNSQRARHFELFFPHWCFVFQGWIEDVNLGVKTCISGSVKVRKSVCLQSRSQPCADCEYSI